MKDSIERRANARCFHPATVTCACFNSDRFYHGRSVNHSKEGINFYSDSPMKPGSNIYVRINSQSPVDYQNGNRCCDGVRTIGLAEVRWCKEIPDAYGAFYSIGLKYHEPAY